MDITASTVHIAGLTCSACQKLITRRISKMPEVTEVVVEPSGKTSIKALRAISEKEVEKALEGTHYTVVTNK